MDVTREGLKILEDDGRITDYMATYSRFARLYVDFIRLDEGIKLAIEGDYSKISKKALEAFRNYYNSCILRSETERVHVEMQILSVVLDNIEQYKDSCIPIHTSKRLCFDCNLMIQKTQNLLKAQGITPKISPTHGGFVIQ